MGAMSANRLIVDSLKNSIGLSGVREDDEFVLDIFQEKKRKFNLKRTRYNILTSTKYSFDFSNSEICLPVFGQAQSEFELLLVPSVNSRSHNDKSRYLMRSKGDSPFKLNGVQCFEAFVERGDIINIGFNSIQFSRGGGDEKISDGKNNFDSKQLTEEVIRSSINIMIEGETGTGKTTLAKIIHDESERHGRFVHLNLSSFAPGLIESELFGHVKGAFTGAICEKRGAILDANNGTLFLDEIDSLSLELQTKLLLFLDNHQVRSVGSNSLHKVDVRLIFASGSKLKKLISQEKMRIDFYYRLTCGVIITLNNLRENVVRIRELCLDFERDNQVTLCDELIGFYQECSWPGNIRQLISHLNKKRILSQGKKIIVDHIDYDLLSDRMDVLFLGDQQNKSLEEVKMDYCLNIFLKNNKNITKSAKILSISPNTLKSLLTNREKIEN